jgi:geranylgeranyl diphosphate synthase type I
VISRFKQFGYDLGLAFQMADDVKGSFWTSAESGKPEAGDIRKGKKTLPLVWALEHAPEPDATRLREIYGPDATWPMAQQVVDEVLGILERCGARETAETEARRWRDIALAELFALPIPDERRAELQSLVDSVIAA